MKLRPFDGKEMIELIERRDARGYYRPTYRGTETRLWWWWGGTSWKPAKYLVTGNTSRYTVRLRRSTRAFQSYT